MLTLLDKIFTILSLSFGFSIIYILSLLTGIWDEISFHKTPQFEHYDYIIVGAGTAGTILSQQLGVNSSVLIVEAGISTIPFIMNIPALIPMFHQTNYDWNYKTVSQSTACKSMKNSQCSFTLGKGYGGSNILNNLIYYSGNPNDYRGWFSDYDNYNYSQTIEPFFLKNEELLQPNELNYLTKFGKAMSTISQIPRLKFFIPKVLQRNGRRYNQHQMNDETLLCSSNTERLTNAVATKILFEDSLPLRAYGIDYEKFGQIKSVYAQKAVILSAGTIGTPKLLLQSGVGPCNELNEIGIKCILNLPGVGKNLQDHIATGMDLIQLNTSLNLSPLQLLSPLNLYQYFHPYTEQKGPLSMTGCEILGFLDNGKTLGFMMLPVGIAVDHGIKLRHVLNIKDEIWENYFKKLINVQTISILPILLHPKSRGEIKLKDSSPQSKPLINPKYLSHQDDVENLVDGIKWIQEILKTPQMQKFNATFNNIKFPSCKNFEFGTKKYWNCYVNHMSFSVYHPVGTCRIGDENHDESVVDRKFKLIKADNIYIVDASIMPNLPSGNPNAVVAMLARKFLDIHNAV